MHLGEGVQFNVRIIDFHSPDNRITSNIVHLPPSVMRVEVPGFLEVIVVLFNYSNPSKLHPTPNLHSTRAELLNISPYKRHIYFYVHRNLVIDLHVKYQKVLRMLRMDATIVHPVRCCIPGVSEN